MTPVFLTPWVRRCLRLRIEVLERVDQCVDLLMDDERKLCWPERRRRLAFPAIGLPGVGMDAGDDALARAREQLEAVMLSPDDEVRRDAIEREPLRRPADAHQRRLAENAYRDVPGLRGDRRVEPVEVDADDIVRAEGKADAVVPVDRASTWRIPPRSAAAC